MHFGSSTEGAQAKDNNRYIQITQPTHCRCNGSVRARLDSATIRSILQRHGLLRERGSREGFRANCHRRRPLLWSCLAHSDRGDVYKR
jgi:hypothetical protein